MPSISIWMPTADSEGFAMPNKLVSAVTGRISTYRKPSHWKIILRDKRGAGSGPSNDFRHLHAAMEWLCRAQDVTGCVPRRPVT